jgi:hypothetical protein
VSDGVNYLIDSKEGVMTALSRFKPVLKDDEKSLRLTRAKCSLACRKTEKFVEIITTFIAKREAYLMLISSLLTDGDLTVEQALANANHRLGELSATRDLLWQVIKCGEGQNLSLPRVETCLTICSQAMGRIAKALQAAAEHQGTPLTFECVNGLIVGSQAS